MRARSTLDWSQSNDIFLFTQDATASSLLLSLIRRYVAVYLSEILDTGHTEHASLFFYNIHGYITS